MTLRQLLTVRRLLLGFLVIGGGAAGVAALASSRQAPAAAERAPVLPVATLQVQRVDQYLHPRKYTGVVKAPRTSELSFKRADKLVELLADEGQHVRQGQTLGRLDDQRLQAKRVRLLSELAQARAVLEELRAGPRPQTVAAQRATVEDLEAQVGMMESQHHRRQRLWQGNAVSQEEVEQSTFGLDSARARLAAAAKQLDELVEGTRPEKITAQEAVVAQLEAGVRDVELEIQESQLVAPFDGWITKRYVHDGMIVIPTTLVFRLVEDQDVEAWIGVPPAVARRLTAEASYPVTVDGESYSANLRSQIAEVDPATRTRTVVLTLPGVTAVDVVPGQVARLEVREPIQVDGFWVPTTALSRGSRGLWSVFVVRAAERADHVQATAQIVEVIYADGQQALVRGTLNDGDQVVASGTHRLARGQRVRAVPHVELSQNAEGPVR